MITREDVENIEKHGNHTSKLETKEKKAATVGITGSHKRNVSIGVSKTKTTKITNSDQSPEDIHTHGERIKTSTPCGIV